MVPTFAAFLLSVALQSTPEQLIDQLRSDRIEERDAAFKELKALGAAARPALEQAIRDPDPEVSRRIKVALRILAIRSSITPNLRKIVPNVDERLATGPDEAFTAVFTQALDSGKAVAADLEPLALHALRGSAGGERHTILIRILNLKLMSAIPEILLLARSPDQQTAGLALQVLSGLNPTAATTLLTAGLKDPDATMRLRAISGLENLRTPGLAPLVAELLSDPDQNVRLAVIQALGNFGDRDMIPRLVPCLTDPILGRSAAQGLVRLRAKEAVPQILPMLKATDESARSVIIETLVHLRVPEAAPEIARGLSSKFSNVRETAAWALVELGARDQGLKIIPLLHDEEEEVRAAALRAVAEFGLRQAGPDVVKLLSDDDATVRVVAAWTAGKLALEDAGPGVIKMLASADRQETTMAAWAAGVLKLRSARPTLLKLALDRNDPTLVAASAAVLLTDASNVDDLIALLPSTNQDMPEVLAPAFRKYHSPGLLQKLVSELKNNATPVAAAELLGLLQDTDAAQPLLKIFRDPAENLLIRRLTALSLARLGHKEILPEVLVLARNDEASGLSHVIRALGALGARDHAKLLMAPLAEAVDEVQLATVDALEQMGAVDQLDALISKMDDLNSPADERAAEWLCRQGRKEGCKALAQSSEIRVALNAFRMPAAWKQLEAVTYTEHLEGTKREIAERIARDAGFELEWTLEEFHPDMDETLARARVRPDHMPLTGGRALSQLMHAMDEEYDVVLEDNVLRVLPSGVAHEILNTWWLKNKDR